MNVYSNFSKISAIACFIACIGDFIVTTLLAFFYPGYNHLKSVMSELGMPESPVAIWISAWWVIYGIFIIIFGVGFGKALNLSRRLTKLSTVLIIIFGIGAGIMAGISPCFPMITTDKIHNVSAGIGFTAILFLPILSLRLFLNEAPRLNKPRGFFPFGDSALLKPSKENHSPAPLRTWFCDVRDKKIQNMSMFSIIVQITGLFFFTIFIISENSTYKNTILEYPGLWQRLFLLNYYVYFLTISYKIFLKKPEKDFFQPL